MVRWGRCGAGCAPPASLAAAAPAPMTAAVATASMVLFSMPPPPPSGPRSARLHDRCLSALLQRLLAALHQGMDRVSRRRRLGAQVEEKFCLCERRLGIAVHIRS